MWISVLLTVVGTLVPSALAGPRSALVHRCARNLAEDVFHQAAIEQLDDWEDSIEAVLRRPERSHDAHASFVRVGFWHRGRERAFVRGSDLPSLGAADSLALARRARALNRTVRYGNALSPPVVYGPQLMTKADVAALFVGENIAERDSLSRSIDRQSPRADRAFRHSLAATAGFLTLAGAATAARVTMELESGWVWTTGAVLVAGLFGTGRYVLRSEKADRYLNNLRRARAQSSLDSLGQFEAVDDGPFRTVEDMAAFRRFASAAAEEWEELGPGDAPRWWYFAGSQGGETLDFLVRSVADEPQDLEVLAIVRGAPVETHRYANAETSR